MTETGEINPAVLKEFRQRMIVQEKLKKDAQLGNSEGAMALAGTDDVDKKVGHMGADDTAEQKKIDQAIADTAERRRLRLKEEEEAVRQSELDRTRLLSEDEAKREASKDPIDRQIEKYWETREVVEAKVSNMVKYGELEEGSFDASIAILDAQKREFRGYAVLGRGLTTSAASDQKQIGISENGQYAGVSGNHLGLKFDEGELLITDFSKRGTEVIQSDGNVLKVKSNGKERFGLPIEDENWVKVGDGDTIKLSPDLPAAQGGSAEFTVRKVEGHIVLEPKNGLKMSRADVRK